MDGLNVLILLLLFPGHCELLAAGVNRMHARPLGHNWLAVSQHSHDFLVFSFLPVGIGFLAWADPPLILAGDFWRSFPLIATYFTICGLGVLSLLAAILKQALRRPEPITSSRVIDVRQTGKAAGAAVDGNDWRARIARWPVNEAATIDVNEKLLAIPQLPPGWEALTIVHVSDVHFFGYLSRAYFQAVFEEIPKWDADLICFTGDLLDRPELVSWIDETLGRLSAPLGCWFILGNHDWLYTREAARDVLVAAGWNDLGRGRSFLLEEERGTLWLAGDETPWVEGAFSIDGADEADLRILLTHTPDHFPRAARAGIDLALAGHNHGGQIRLPLIGPVYAPSRYGVRFSGGTYRLGQSVLHVSRGVSARRPIRWNCRPEITRLTLRAAPCGKHYRQDEVVQSGQQDREHRIT